MERGGGKKEEEETGSGWGVEGEKKEEKEKKEARNRCIFQASRRMISSNSPWQDVSSMLPMRWKLYLMY